MKLFMTSFTLIACMATTNAVMAQAISEEEATIRVTQWVADDVIEATDAAIERFAISYPNVTIEAAYIPLAAGNWGDYNNAFINEVAAGNAPDIVGAAIEGFAEMASTGVLMDLDTLVASDDGAKAIMAGISSNMLDGMRTRGTDELNFFPTQWNNIVMYYNRDLFDDAGVEYPSDDWTWDDFLVVAEALTVKDDSGKVTQYGYYVPGFNFGLQPWLFTNSASTLSEDWTEPTADTPEYRESLQFLSDLINVHGVAPAYEAGVGTERFTAGQVAMFSAGHWPVPAIRDAGLENVGVQFMPMKSEQTTVFGIGGLAILKETPNPDLAWAFLSEMTGDEYQQGLADGGASIPSVRAFATTEEYVAWPYNSEIFYETADTALPVPAPPNFAQVQEITDRYLATFFNEEVSLEDTISGMDRELQRAMKRASR